jgi:Ca2+-transporting ATPase
LIAVIIVSNVNAVNSYQKDIQFRLLEKEKDNENVFAVRDGKVIQLRSFDIVVGDIINLNRGDKIPADGIMLDGKGKKYFQLEIFNLRKI